MIQPIVLELVLLAEQDVLQMTKPEYAKQIMPKGEPMPTTRRKFNPATGRIE